MSLGRILSSFSLKCRFSASRFSFHNVGLQIRHFSPKPSFNFGRIREPNDAVALFREMVRMQPRPSVVHFTELLIAVVEMKQYSLALELFDELLLWDISIKQNHSLSIPMHLFYKMARLSPSVYGYSKFLSAVVKIKQYSVALHLFHQMLPMDAPVNDYTLSIAINCFCSLKRADFGFAILGSFFKLGHEPDVVTFTTLIKGLMLVGKIQEAAKLLRKLVVSGLCYPDEVTYNTMINGLCKAGHVLDALDLLRSLEKGSCKPNLYAYTNVVTYSILIDAVCKQGQIEEANELLLQMLNKGLLPDVVTYNVLIGAVCKRGRIEEAKQLLLQMINKGLQPNVVTYTTLIDAVCKQGQIDKAKNMLHQMENNGLQPNVVTYNILIGAVCKLGEIEDVKELLLEMRNKGCLPDSVTYNVFVRGLLKRNKSHDVGVYLEEMYTKGYTIEDYTLSMLMKSQDAALLDKVKKLV